MKHINIQEIMMYWGFPEVRVLKRFHPDSPRIVAKVRAGGGDYVLKGIPDLAKAALWEMLTLS